MQNTGTGTSTSFWMSGESEGSNDVPPSQSGEFAYSFYLQFFLLPLILILK